MKIPVTQEGVVLPRQWFPDVDEVEVRRENGCVVVAPATPDDPIRQLGTDPISVDVSDASVHHDRYLYES
ncbi:MAG: hypothetical protein ACE5KM_02290 [Planctomycetaceae bacterium]